MRNWNKYMESDEQDEDILAEWEEVLLKDFDRGAYEWLVANYDMIHWKVGLE